MKRRRFLGAGTSALAAASVVAPAVAQSLPSVKWRMASSFPKSLDTIYGTGEVMADRLSKITGGRFQVRVFAAGEIVPGLQVLDAVQQGTVECGHSSGAYYVGKDKAFTFFTALPFGMNTRQQEAWMRFGGGQQLMDEFFRSYNMVTFLGGNTGCQMGGWWRKEIKSLAELKGLKFRIPGIGGEIWARLGLVPQTIAGGDIYPALERGTIDGAEWIGPYDDEKLGFYKVAKHYYFPGWWEPGPQLEFMVNAKQWESLPKEYQAAFEAAAAQAAAQMVAGYDAKNPAALQRLVNNGVKLHQFPKEILQAAHRATTEWIEEESARNAAFKKIHASWGEFRKAQVAWARIGEQPLESFIASAR